MVKVAPVILPELYRIFVTTGQYSNRSRSRAITVFITCTDVIIELSQMDKVSLQSQTLLPLWVVDVSVECSTQIGLNRSLPGNIA